MDKYTITSDKKSFISFCEVIGKRGGGGFHLDGEISEIGLGFIKILLFIFTWKSTWWSLIP